MVRRGTSSPGEVQGDVDTGYGPVADAFRRNLSSGLETGAAVAVYRDGHQVVDLSGGHRSGATMAPWTEDTLVNVFSTTKGVAALTVAVAVARGLLDYDTKIADYWPEFAQAGKGGITVRQLLAHQAGLVAIEPAFTLAELADPVAMGSRLAAQAPAWRPGTRHGYHAVTLGWYESELIRRVDPQHRTLGRFFAEELARPLGLELYIGLPATVDRERVALLEPLSKAGFLRHFPELPPKFTMALLNSRSLTMRAFTIAGGVAETAALNRDELRVIELPSVNGTADARSIAKLYGDAAIGGLGLTSGVRAALEAPAAAPSGGMRDLVFHSDMSYSLGFGKPRRDYVFGSSGRAYGWPGMGGSFGFADPDTGVGYAYVMNRMGGHPRSDPRELALRQALFRDVLRARPQL